MEFMVPDFFLFFIFVREGGGGGMKHWKEASDNLYNA